MNKRYILHADDKHKESVKANALSFISNLSMDKSVEIIIRRYRKSHSDEQRGSFHFLCQVFGDRLGYTKGEIKEMVKKHVYGVRTVHVGSKCFEVTESSEVDENGEPRDTLDYGRLIEGIYILAAEVGEILPALDPAHWLKKAG